MQEASILFQDFAFLCLHNHPKINNWHPEENLRIQKGVINHNIVHEYHLSKKVNKEATGKNF
jgi:hypothetical protein